jgi:hypothetical protein
MAESSRNRGWIAWGIGLIGVAVGAAIGAGTGMWWMMGVLGGVFGAVAYPLTARKGKG